MSSEHRQLIPTVRPWFEKAFAECEAQVPGLMWEVGIASLPNPTATAGEPRLTSVLVLYLQAPTGNEVQHVVNTVLMSPGFDQAYVTNTVADAVGSMANKLAEIGEGFAVPEGDLEKAANG